MTIIKRILLSICFVFLLICCSTKDIKNSNLIPTLKVTNDLVQHNLKLSELIGDCKLIPLVTTEECIIGQIDKIVFHNDQFYILDHSKANAIFIFSSEGKYLWKLSRMGKGPGEYIELVDFSFEPETNNLVILNMKSLMYYDHNNGEYLKTIKLPFIANNFEYSTDGHISFVIAGNGDNLVITDVRGRIESSYFKYIKETKLLLHNPFVRNDAADLLFLTNLDYTIYKINGKQITPYIRIDFEKDMYSAGDLHFLKEDKANIHNFYAIRNYFESSNKIFIEYFYKKIPYYLICDKITNRKMVLNYFEIDNDVSYTKFLPRIMGYDSNRNFISFIEPNELKSSISNKNISDVRMKEIANASKSMDNPILFLFKFR